MEITVNHIDKNKEVVVEYCQTKIETHLFDECEGNALIREFLYAASQLCFDEEQEKKILVIYYSFDT